MSDILDPTIASAIKSIDYVARPKDLKALRIGLVENSKKNSEAVLQKISEKLEALHGMTMQVLVHKQQREPLDEAQLGQLKGVDFVIVGVGDCGACSSGSLLDAIILEKAGIPAVGVITDVFKTSVRQMARLAGVPDFQVAMMPHPLATLGETEIDREAEALVARILALLQTGQSSQNRTQEKAKRQEQSTSITSPAASPSAQIERCFTLGWTDGLPVVPATRALVDSMLNAAALAPDMVLGHFPARDITITAEKAAINAVMAGCKPEYMPVIVAALKAMAIPEFGLHHVASGHSGSAIVIIVNGPIAVRLGINSTNNVFGPGVRANAAIGRTLRLILLNCLKYTPGVADRATMGNPGKYTCCIAENEENHPWQPWHVGRGFKPEQSAVTLVGTGTMMQVWNYGDHEPLLRAVGDALSYMGSLAMLGQTPGAVVFGGEHAEMLRASGWTLEKIREFIMEHSSRSIASLERAGVRPVVRSAAGRFEGSASAEDEEALYYAIRRSTDLMLLCAGGPIGPTSMVLPGFSGERRAGRSPTILIEEPAD